MSLLTLSRHPSTPCEAVRRLTANAQWLDGKLALHYALEGDLTALHLPPPAAPKRTDGLWQTTCFEVFLNSSEGYCEFNFAPSSAWAAYRFQAYRTGMVELDLPAPPTIVLRHSPNRLELDAQVELPHLAQTGKLSLAVSAVVADPTGQISYWALAHPPGKPDFHHADGFIARFAVNGCAYCD